MSSIQKKNCPVCESKQEQHCCEVVYRRNKIVERVSYEEWLPNVRILAPEVPDEILLDYIRRGAIEFAKKTHILKRIIWIKVQECVADYYLCLGEEERIHVMHQLSYNGMCFDSVGDTCCWMVDDHKFWFHPPVSLEIHPAPRSDHDQVFVNVVVAPSEYSNTVDKLIFDRYFEAIEHYAVAKAHLIPNVPATSGEAHTYRMNQFKKEVNDAKVWVAENYSNDVKFDEVLSECMC